MSFKLLHEAQSKLKNIIHSRFDSAVRSRDAASVERFFKTFPLIGEHKAGLEKFSKYLCTQVISGVFLAAVAVNGGDSGGCICLSSQLTPVWCAEEPAKECAVTAAHLRM